MKIPLYDYVSAAGFLLLLAGLLLFVIVGRDAPAYLVTAFNIFVGAFARSGLAVANEYRHRSDTP